MKDILSIFDNQVVDEQITNVTPDPPKKDKKTLQKELIVKYMDEYGITNPYLKAAMMGIVLNEGGFSGKSENMYYVNDWRLAQVFSIFSNKRDSRGRRIRAGLEPGTKAEKKADAIKHTRKDLASQYIKNPEKLANFIYNMDNRPGLGNDQPGDGWKYRGRGNNGITGKAAYARLGKQLGVDLVNNPDLLSSDPDLQAKATVQFFHNQLAKTLPAIVKSNPRRYKRYAKYVDYNSVDNIEDATYLLTSANGGLGNVAVKRELDKRLKMSVPYITEFVNPETERKEEGLQDEFVIDSDELATTEDPVVEDPVEESVIEKPVIEEPVAISTNRATPNFREEVDTPKIEENITPLPVDIPTSVNTTPPDLDFSEPQFVNSNVQNFSAEELKRQEAFNRALSESIMTNRAIPKFGQGQLFGADRKKYGGSIRPRYYNNGGPLDWTVTGVEEQGPIDPMKFMVDAETGNLKTYNFDTGKFEVSDTAFEGDTSGMMSHIADIYADDDNSYDAVLARSEKASDLAEWSAARTKGAQDQIAERSIRNLGRDIGEQGAPFQNFLRSIGGAHCITGSSCNLSPTPGDPTEPNEENLARVPYFIKDKKGNWVPNKPYTKSGRQKVGENPTAAEQDSAPLGGVPGGPIPVITGNQSFASRWPNFGMEMQKQSVLPQPGDIQVQHGFEEKEWKSYDPDNIERGNLDTGYWRRKKNPDGSPVFTDGRFVYGMKGNSNHAQTIGPIMTQEIADRINDAKTRYRDVSADENTLAKTNNWGGGDYVFVDKVDPNEPTYKGTATMRYKGSDPMFQKIAADARNREMTAFANAPVEKLSLAPVELLPNKYPKFPNKLPSVLREEIMEKMNNRAYATGGDLGGSPCPSGQIYDTTSEKCVSYETWEKNNSGFNMEDVKKENEDYFNANEWFRNYHNSPKYYEMTRSSFPKGGVGDMQAGILRRRRNQNLESIPPLKISPQEEAGLAGLSYGETGEIEVFPEGFETGTTTHELSHSTDRPVYFYPHTQIGRQRIIPISDSKYIDKRKADVLGDSREYFNYKGYYDDMIENDPERFKRIEERFLDFSNYVAEDTETRARLNTIRRMAQEQGLYDPFTEGVSPDLYYQKLKKLQFKNTDRNLLEILRKQGFNPMKQLQDTFSDEEIIWMLNNISENKTNNSNDIEGMA